MARSNDTPTSTDIKTLSDPEQGGGSDLEAAVSTAGEHLHGEASLRFDTTDHEVALESDTVRFTALLNDLGGGFEVNPESACLTVIDGDGEEPVLIAERGAAMQAYHEGLTADQRELIRESKTDAARRAREPHPSKTVGERNPRL